jgi:hypothetical protein
MKIPQFLKKLKNHIFMRQRFFGGTILPHYICNVRRFYCRSYNLTICYNLVQYSSFDWQEETAFGAATAGAGNAWWYAIDANTFGTYSIYAGQNAVSGDSVT